MAWTPERSASRTSHHVLVQISPTGSFGATAHWPCEYVPGNLIYANAHKFVPRTFHLVPEEPIVFAVDLANEAIQETGGLGKVAAPTQAESVGVSSIFGVQVCDVDAPHQSYISDDEDYRFQLPVAVYGQDQGRHSGGKAYEWGLQRCT